MNSFQNLWGKCLTVIKDNVPAAHYDTWFKPIIPLSYNNNTFTIQVPSQFFYEYLETHYADMLKLAIDREIGLGTMLNYRVVVDNSTKATVDYPTEKGNSNVHAPLAVKQNAAAITPNFAPAAPQGLDSQLNARYNFDNYFEGISNKFVRVAGETVAENPGKTAFNPLFIFGPSGVGKTHLCHAIGQKIKERHEGMKVLYISAHDFCAQFVEATRRNTTNDFIFFYQNLDVLIMDDVQDMIGKEKTQNSFFHIFNHLHLLNKQLVLTSDKSPADMQGMEERMITRLRWGLPAEIMRPDLGLRKAILKGKAIYNDIKIPDDVIAFIAENVTENARDLEGIVVALQARAIIVGSEINIDVAKQVIEQTLRIERKPVTIQDVHDVVCNYYRLDKPELQAKTRKHEIVEPRQVAMYLAKKFTNKSLAQIGRLTGNRDHATVSHGIKVVESQMKVNRSYKAMIESLEEKLNQKK
jgi:chromosomal replication initiator protein